MICASLGRHGHAMYQKPGTITHIYERRRRYEVETKCTGAVTRAGRHRPDRRGGNLDATGATPEYRFYRRCDKPGRWCAFPRTASPGCDRTAEPGEEPAPRGLRRAGDFSDQKGQDDPSLTETTLVPVNVNGPVPPQAEYMPDPKLQLSTVTVNSTFTSLSFTVL